MNKNVFSFISGLGIGLLAGQHLCKKSMASLHKGEKIQLNLPSSIEEAQKRIPRAVTAVTKELLDPKTIDIKSGEIK